MDLMGVYGGPFRPPRPPLIEEHEKAVRAAIEAAAQLESDA